MMEEKKEHIFGCSCGCAYEFQDHQTENSRIIFSLLIRLHEEFLSGNLPMQYVFEVRIRMDWIELRFFGEQLFSHWHSSGLINEEEQFQDCCRQVKLMLSWLNRMVEWNKFSEEYEKEVKPDELKDKSQTS
jgi:hypothetical protein